MRFLYATFVAYVVGSSHTKAIFGFLTLARFRAALGICYSSRLFNWTRIPRYSMAPKSWVSWPSGIKLIGIKDPKQIRACLVFATSVSADLMTNEV